MWYYSDDVILTHGPHKALFDVHHHQCHCCCTTLTLNGSVAAAQGAGSPDWHLSSAVWLGSCTTAVNTCCCRDCMRFSRGLRWRSCYAMTELLLFVLLHSTGCAKG